MNNRQIDVDIRQLPKGLMIAAAVFSALAAILGLLGAVALLDPAYQDYLRRDIIDSGIVDRSAINTYFLIHCGLMVAGPVLAGFMAVCLLMTLDGRPDRGLGILSTVSQWLVWAMNAAGIVLVILFAYRFVIYTIGCLGAAYGLYPLYAMIASETLMVVLTVLIFVKLRKFLTCLSDSAATVAYTLCAGKTDDHTIASFTATGFLLLSIFCFVFMVNQAFTLTAVYDLKPYYKLLISQEPAQLCSVGCFACCAIGNLLLWAYMRRYKRICEQAIFQNRRKILLEDIRPGAK